MCFWAGAPSCTLSGEGAPAARKSTLSAELSDVPADGVSRASVRLTLRDADDVGIPQVNVAFFAINNDAVSGNVIFFQPSATDANGEATGLLASASVGNVDVGVRLQEANGWVTLAPITQVRFRAVDANDNDAVVLTFAAQAQRIVANDNNSVQLDLTATAVDGRPLTGSTVRLTSIAPGVTFTPQEGLISSIGTFSATMRSSSAGPIDVHAALLGAAADTTVTFVAGPFDKARSGLMSDTNVIGADGVSLAAATLRTRDAFSNPISGLAVDFAVDLPGSRVLPSRATTNVAGLASATVSGSVVGVTTLTAHVADTNYALPLQILAPQPSALYSRIDLPDRAVQADGVSTMPVTITVLDLARQPVAGRQVTVSSVDGADVFMPATGVTDANGLFVTLLGSQHAGAKSFIAAFGTGYVGATATFVALDADPTRSSWQATPTTVPAGRLPTVTLLLQARDSFGNPAAFEPVALTTSSPNAVATPALGQTDGNGFFHATLASAGTGDVLVTAKLRSTSLTEKVRFVAGDPNVARSVLTVDPPQVPADGISEAVLVAYFIDALGNEIDTCNVAFAVNANAEFGLQRGLPGVPGTAAVRLISSVAQTTLVRATCNGVSISAPVNFVAGPPSTVFSTLAAMPPVGIADGNSVVAVMLRVRDAKNNPIATRQVSWSGVGAGATVSPSSGMLGADGSMLVRLKSPSPTVQTVRATVGGVELALAVPFVAAGPDAATSSLALEPNVLRADGLSTARVTARMRDASGNPIVNREVRFAAPGVGPLLAQGNVTTDAYGSAQTQLTSSVASVQPVFAQVGNLTLSGNVTFTAGSASAARSRLRVSAALNWTVAGVATALADGTPRLTAVVHLADEQNNPIAGAEVRFASDVASDVLSAPVLVTNAAGDCTATLGSTVAGTRGLSAVAGSLTLQASAQLVAGAVAPGGSALVASAQNVVADGVAASRLTLALTDAFGNAVSGQSVRFDVAGGNVADVLDFANTASGGDGTAWTTLRSVHAGTKRVTASGSGFALQQNVSFVAGAVSAAASSYALVPPVGLADGNAPLVLQLNVRDAFGNAVPQLQVDVTDDAPGDTLLASGAASDANGSWNVRLRTGVSGVRTLTVQAGPATWRIPVTFLPGPPAGLSTLAVAPTTLSVEDAAPATVQIIARDALGNLVPGAEVALTTPGLAVLGATQGVTGDDGSFATTLATQLAGVQRVRATVASPNDANVFVALEANATFVPGAVDTAHIVRRVSPYPPRAGEPFTGTLVVSDAYNNRVPGAAVSLTSSASGDQIVGGVGVTDANGTFVATATSYVSGLHYATAVVGGTSQTLPLYVLPGAASAANSTLVVQPASVPATGIDLAVATLTARDAYGNPAANQRVDFAASAGLTPLPPVAVTDAAGVAQATLTSVAACPATLTATLGNVTLQAQLGFVAGAVDAVPSQLSVSPNAVVADGNATATLTVALADAFGNPAAGRAVLLASLPAQPVVLGDGGTTDANGRWTSPLRGTVAGAVALQVQAEGTVLPGLVTFLPGPASATTSSLTALPNALDVDLALGTTLVLDVRDAQGNPVAGQQVTLAGPLGDAPVLPGLATTDAAGRVLATWRPTRPATVQLRATVGGAGGLALAANVAVAAGAASPLTSTLTASPNVALADGSAVSTLTLRLADALGNPRGNEPVSLTVSGGNNVLGAGPASTDVNGAWATTLRSSTAELKGVVVRAAGLALPTSVAFVAGAPSLATSSLRTLVLDPIADGVTGLFTTATVRDATGNPVVGRRVTLSSNGPGDVLAPDSCVTGAAGTCSVALVARVAGARTVLADVAPDALGAGGLQLSQSVTFVPGSFDPQASTLTLEPNLVVADGNAVMRARVRLRDAGGNGVAGQAVALEAQGSGTSIVPPSGSSDANGVFCAALTSTVSGVKVVAARIGGAGLVATGWFTAGAVDANRSAVASSSSSVVADGVGFALLTVWAMDAFGNPVVGAPVTWGASDANVAIAAIQSVTDAAGTAQAHARSSVAAAVQVQASVAGVAVSRSLSFVAGQASLATSSVVLQPSIATAGVPSTLTATLRDARGNPVVGQAVNLTANGGNVAITPSGAVSDANGQWSAQLLTTQAASSIVIVAAGATQLVTTLTVAPAGADAGHSALVLAPNQLLADGIEDAQLTCVLRDAYDNPVVGQNVTFAVDGANCFVAPPSGVTDATGSAHALFTGLTAQSTVVRASAASGVGLAANVQLLPGLASDQTVTLTASPNLAVADGLATVALRFTLRDAQANAIAGQPVTFGASGSGAQLLADAATDGNGVATALLTSTLAESKRVTASAGGAHAQATVRFVAGAPSALRSALSASPTNPLADGNAASNVVLVLRDATNNPVPGYAVTWSLAGAGLLGASTSTTDAAGTAQVRLTSTTLGLARVSLLGGALGANVTFVPGALDATRATFVASPNVAVADGQDAVTLQLRALDASGNPIAGETVSFAGGNPLDVWSMPTATTDATGTSSVQVTSTTAGDWPYTANVAGTAFVAPVRFVHGDPSPARTKVFVVPSLVTADGNAKAGVVVMAYDAQNNPAEGATVRFAALGANTLLAPTIQALDATGTAAVEVRSTTAQSEQLAVTVTYGNANYTALGNVTFVAGAPKLSTSWLTLSPTTLVADVVQTARLEVNVRDAFGNPVVGRSLTPSLPPAVACAPPAGATDANGRFVCALSSALAGSAAVTVDLGTGVLAGNVTFVPGAVDVASSTLVASPNVLVADATQQANVVLVLRDTHGNAIAQQNVVWSVDALAADGATLAPGANATDASGTATTTLRERRAGVALVTATWQPGNASLVVPVTFLAGAAQSAQTALVASPNQATADGAATVTLLASVRDGQGNPVPGQSVTMASPGVPSVLGLPASGTTDANGTYAVGVRSTVAQARTVALAAGSAVAAAPVRFVAGSPNAATSLWAGPAVPILADGVTQAGFALALRDSFGNPVSGVSVAFAASAGNVALSPNVAVTDAAGVASTAAVGRKDGTASVVVSFAGASLSANATFIAGTPSLAQTTLACAPGPVVADGASTANCLLTARDAFGNPTPGQAVTVSSGQPTLAFSPTNANTNGQGLLAFTATSRTAQLATITASTVSAAPQAQVSFVAGPPDNGHASLTVSPNVAVANGNSRVSVLLSLADAQGNPVVGQAATFAATGTGGNYTVPAGVTGSGGTLSTAFASLVAEGKQLSVSAGGLNLQVTASFVAGPVAAARSSLSASPNAVLADGNAAVGLTVAVQDATGNPVPGQGVVLASSGGNNAFDANVGVTDANGRWTSALRSTTAQAKVLTASVGGATLNAAATFLPGLPQAAGTTLVTDRAVVTADGTSQAQLTLTVRDAFGNPVPGQAVSFAGAGAGGAFTSPTATTGNDGTARTQLSSTVAEAKTLQASVAGLTPSVGVTFVAGSPNSAVSTLTSDVNVLVANGNQVATLTWRVRDAQANPVANQAVNWSSTSPNAQLVAGAATTDASGRATLSFAGTVAGATTVTAQAGALSASLPLTLVAGPAAAGRSSFVLSPNVLSADAVSTATATLRLRDAYNNPVAGQNVMLTSSDASDVVVVPSSVTAADGSFVATLASAHAGVHVVTAQAAGLSFSANATFLTGSLSAAGSTLTLTPNAVVADGNAAVAVRVVLRDALGNPVTNQLVTLSHSGAAASFVPPSGSTDQLGAFTAQLTSTLAQRDRITASAAGVVLSANATFVAGPASVAQSRLVASPNVVAADGTSAVSATLTLADAQANPIASQAVSFSTTGAQATLSAPTGTTDATGSATTQVRSTLAQAANVRALAAGQNFVVPVTFVAGQPSSTGSTIVFNPNRAAVADGVDVLAVAVRVGDAQGNPIAGQNVFFSSIGNAMLLSPNAGVTNPNGALATAVTSSRAGPKVVRATFGSDAGAPSLATTLTFVAGPPSAANSTLVLSPNVLSADGNTQATVRLVAQDACGNLVGGQNVALSANGVANAFGQLSGLTASDGSFVTTLSSTVAQLETVQAVVGGATLLAPVTFRPGEPSVTKSTLAVVPPALVASATDDGNVVLTLRDGQNNVISGVVVTLASPVVNGVLARTSGVTDANGQLQSGLHATLAQASQVQAYFGAASLSQNFAVVAAAPSGVTSTIAASPNLVTADGVAVTTLRVVAKDAFGNLAGGQNVALSANGLANAFAATTGLTGADGAWQTTLSSTKAQAEWVQATLGGAGGPTVSVPVTFKPGPPSSARSTLLLSPNTLVASASDNGNAYVTLRDAQDNLVPGVTVSFLSPMAGGGFGRQSSVSDVNGQVATGLHATVAQASQVLASFAGGSLSGNFVVVAGPPSSTTSALAVTPNAVTTDNAATATLRVLAQDAFGNPTPGQSVALSASGLANTFGQTGGLTGADGTFTTTLSSPKAQSEMLTASIGGAGGPNVTASVTFKPGVPLPALSALTLSPNAFVASATDNANVTVTLRDAQSNLVPGATVSFTSPMVGGAFGRPSSVSDANGQVSSGLHSTAAQANTLLASFPGGSLGGNFVVFAGPPALTTSSLAVSPNAVTTDNATTTTVRVTALDTFGNPAIGQNVALSANGTFNTFGQISGQTGADGSFTTTLSSPKAQLQQLAATIGGAGGPLVTAPVTFKPGAPSLAQSSLTLSPNTFFASASDNSSVAIVLRDAQSNAIPNANVTFSSAMVGGTLSRATSATDANGLSTSGLHATVAQTSQLLASFTGGSLSGNFVVVAGPPASSTSSLVVSPNAVSTDNVATASLRVLALDAFGNPTAGQNVTLSANGTLSVFGETSGQTGADGAFSTTLSSTKAQLEQLTATLGGAGGPTVSAPITFKPGVPSPAFSTFVPSPNAFVASATDNANVTVVLRDAQNNAVPGVTVGFTSPMASGGFGRPNSATDANGQASSGLHATAAQASTLLASFTGGSLGGNFVVFAGPPALATSSLVVSPNAVTTDNATTTTVRVTALDTFGNPAIGQNVALSANGLANVFGQTSGLTGADGSFTTQLSSTKAQLEAVTAAIGGAGGPSFTSQVSFTPGAPVVGLSSLAVTPNVLVASAADNGNVLLTLRDAQNNPTPGVNVGLSSPVSNGALSRASGFTDANGQLRSGLHATLVQASQVAASFGGLSLGQNFSIVAAPPSVVTSSLVASPNTATANGSDTIDLGVVVQDFYGNPLASVPLTLSGSGTSNQFGATTGSTSASGTWATTLRSTLAQVQNLTVSTGSPNAIALVTRASFVAGAPLANATSFGASPANFVADNVASTSFAATVRDAYNNPVPNQNVTVALVGSSLTNSPVAGVTDATGTFATTVRTTLAQALSANATVNGGFTLTTNANAVPGPTSKFLLAGIAGGMSAVVSSPQLTALDAFNNVTPSFAGAVAFSSSDPVAVLPGNYTFNASDAGSRNFASSVTLVTPGTQSVTAQAVSAPSIAGSQTGLVVGAPSFAQATLTSQALASSCLDLQNGSLAAGTPLVAKTCTNLVNEVFSFGTDGTLRVLGNCVAVSGASYVAGQPVVANACTAAVSQRWALTGQGTLASVGNPNFCLDLGAASSGTPATVQNCNALSAGQAFTVRSVAPRYALVNGALQQTLEVVGGTLTAGTVLQNNNFLNATNQAFLYGSDQTLSIGGLCVAPQGGAALASKTLLLASCNGTVAQKFAFSGNNVVSLADTTLCLDMGTSTTPTVATLKTCGAGAGQIVGATVQALGYRYLNYSAITQPLCLDVNAPLGTGMPPVLSAPCNAARNQSWSTSTGANTDVMYSNACLDAQIGLLSLLGLSTYNGQLLYANTCSGSVTQNFRPTPTSSSTFILRWLATGNYCVNASTTSGNQVQLGTCNFTNTNQMFAQLAQSTILQAAGTPSLCVDVSGGLPVAGAALKFAGCTASATQSFTPATDGSLQIGEQCLDAPGGLSAGSVVRLGACTGAATQKWNVTATSVNTQSIAVVRSASTSFCFDASNAATGVPVTLAACSGQLGQTFAVR